ncbi:hypothetical protein DICVIV_01496 [Dictyocaulus viviparus]|uniref:Uncharacterized protein n=1 Tax=Dictyocaulus viviparus TaxID=29172 RepID=A0A0D8Y8J6_DICVI|nr:hypothetical protein DICVIV_01496 [Dictyocaulus viviparus]
MIAITSALNDQDCYGHRRIVLEQLSDSETTSSNRELLNASNSMTSRIYAHPIQRDNVLSLSSIAATPIIWWLQPTRHTIRVTNHTPSSCVKLTYHSRDFPLIKTSSYE